jgi:hypothetical protein
MGPFVRAKLVELVDSPSRQTALGAIRDLLASVQGLAARDNVGMRAWEQAQARRQAVRREVGAQV